MMMTMTILHSPPPSPHSANYVLRWAARNRVESHERDANARFDEIIHFDSVKSSVRIGKEGKGREGK